MTGDAHDMSPSDDAEEGISESDTGTMQTPPATLDFLVHTLFTQALMALGRIPNPITQKAMRNIPTAKHFIDTLAMLEQKTAGNRSVDENRLLEEVHCLIWSPGVQRNDAQQVKGVEIAGLRPEHQPAKMLAFRPVLML